MGTVKVCVHEMAKTPYFVEATGIHLYSIEELAYYLYENIYLIDEKIIDEKLYSWIETELGMVKLGERLRNGKNTGSQAYNQVMAILQASEYYTENELGKLSEKIKMISGMQTQERMKYKADELMQNENFWGAISEYERILGIRQSSRLTVEFYARVWNNLAGCYARLFLFEKAAGCYEKAYQFQKIAEYKEKAFQARRLAVYGQQSEEILSEDKISEEFIKQTENIFAELEAKSKAHCEKISPAEFLKNCEKNYY
jgi:tetratricopeptide (TPR) repeat protein